MTNTRLFWRKVAEVGTCWLWLGYTEDGYGKHGHGPGTRLAHRIAYEMIVGPVPEGMELDHLCRVRACVNPNHMEPVEHRENVLRGEGLAAQQARAETCHKGHPWTEENTYRHPRRRLRRCRQCRRDREGRTHRPR